MKYDSKNIVVAVDGPAGSGKSTISRRAALATGISYVDSGALYRAATLYFLRAGFPPSERDIAGLNLSQCFLADGSTRTFIGGEDVSDLLRDENLLKSISSVASLLFVRVHITAILREWAKTSSIIMDGRDIGSVVFPDADVKIYLDASVDIRARRRCDEYAAAGKNVDFNSIKNQINLRDSDDMKRPVGALVRCADAMYVDSSGMKPDEVVQLFVDTIKAAMMRQ